jgi:hypothetical protein
VHRFTDVNTKTLIKEIRKRELVMNLKKKKFLFTENTASLRFKLSDLYTQCTVTKKLSLGDHALDLTVMIQKAVKKEVVEVNNPKKELAKVPKAWRNADGSKIDETPATP